MVGSAIVDASTRKLRGPIWTDIPTCELRALDPVSGEVRWSLPEQLCSFALTADEDVLLMGLASCLGYYNLSNCRFSNTVTPGVSGARINNCRWDRIVSVTGYDRSLSALASSADQKRVDLFWPEQAILEAQGIYKTGVIDEGP